MFGLTLVLATLLLWLQPEALWLKTLAITVLAWWLPGLLLVALWRLPEIERANSTLGGAGNRLGMVGWCRTVATLAAWTGHGQPHLCGIWDRWIPALVGPVSPASMPLQPTPSRVWLQAGLLLIGLLLLWLPTLGAREFFHDETTVLVQARAALRGVADAPARHTKGPGEIIAAMVFYRSLGTTNEFYARLPFALSGIGAVLLMLPLGRRLFSAQVGLWAALLLASTATSSPWRA